MKLKYMFLISVLISLLFLSCKQQSTNPVNSDNQKLTSKLAKKGWYYSDMQYWTYQSNYNNGCWTTSINLRNSSFSFSFRGYTFSFSKGSLLMSPQSYQIQVSVNGTLVATLNSTLQNASFVYDNKNMNISSAAESYYSMWSSCYNRNESYMEPNWVEAGIEDYVSPDAPSGFVVSPVATHNPNQIVTVSWTASSDPDVTGYQIFRGSENQSYQLIQEIGSRSTTQWLDTSVPWSSTFTIARYYMKAVDGTHGLVSSPTESRSCAQP
jgi:hypothetical protein